MQAHSVVGELYKNKYEIVKIAVAPSSDRCQTVSTDELSG